MQKHGEGIFDFDINQIISYFKNELLLFKYSQWLNKMLRLGAFEIIIIGPTFLEEHLVLCFKGTKMCATLIHRSHL